MQNALQTEISINPSKKLKIEQIDTNNHQQKKVTEIN